MNKSNFWKIVEPILDEFQSRSEVAAIATAGSSVSDFQDYYSDIDIYIFINQEIPVTFRKKVAERYGMGKIEIDNRFWGPGDEWMDRGSQTKIDLMYWEKGWIEDQLAKVLDRHQASMGYSSCFWYTIRNCQIIYDSDNWLEKLKEKASQPYPRELKNNIIRNNYPVLKDIHSSYLHQIELAIIRKDQNSVIHRCAELLASYFDLLFAINELPHPGEKRLPDKASLLCHKLPTSFNSDLTQVFNRISSAKPPLIKSLRSLINHMGDLMIAEGVLSQTGKLILGESGG